MLRRITAILVAVLLAAASGIPVGAGETPPDAKDHAALAAMYSSEDKALRQKVADHELMLHRYENAATFAKGIPFPKATLVQHCRKLVASYKEAASNAEALAKMEGELAQAKPASK
jgi:hypothetical protein